MRFDAFSLTAAIRWQYPQALPVILALVVISVLAVLLTYRSQTRAIAPVNRWLLPTLRILAISVLLVSMLRPILSRPRSATERAPIVLLFDDSRSMSVIDVAREPAETVGILASLQKLPQGVPYTQTQELQNRCDLLSSKADEVIRARAEVDYARLSGRGQQTALARLNLAVDELQTTARIAASEAEPKQKSPGEKSFVQKSTQLEKTLAYIVQGPAGTDRQAWLDHIREKARSAANQAEQARSARDAQLYRDDPEVRAACGPLQSLSRVQISESVVFDPTAGLLVRLGAETSAAAFAVSDQVTSIPLQRRDVSPHIAAGGSFTNLNSGIRAVVESFGTTPPRAVVIFSDGRQVSGDPESVAISQGVPIFTVVVASRSGIRDLSIQNVLIPGTAVVGEPVVLHAEVRAAGLNGTKTNLTVRGGGPDETRTITFADDHNLPVQFTRQFSSPGVQRITLELEGVSGEMSRENNRVERWINVMPRSSTRPADALRNSAAATRPTGEAEMADLTGDEGTLRRLSEATGGQFFRLDQMDLLSRRLSLIHDDVNPPVEIPLWDGPYLIALVLGCLTAEWGLRKRFGLI